MEMTSHDLVNYSGAEVGLVRVLYPSHHTVHTNANFLPCSSLKHKSLSFYVAASEEEYKEVVV